MIIIIKLPKANGNSTNNNNNKILCQFNNLKFPLSMNINTNKIMKYGIN